MKSNNKQTAQEQMWTVEQLEPKLLLSADLMPGIHEITGNIEKPGEQKQYEFVVTEKTKIFFDGVDGAKFNWSLKGKEFGQNFSTTQLEQDSHNFIDLVPDTYQLTVDGEDDQTGNYTFRMLGESAAIALNVNEQTELKLNPSSQAVLYKVQLNQGDRVFFESQTSNATWSIFDPDANLIKNRLNSSGYQGFEALIGGTYWLSIEGNDSQNSLESQFILHASKPEVIALKLNEKTTVNFNKPFQSTQYSFNLEQNQWIGFDQLTTGLENTEWLIKDSIGNTVFSNKRTNQKDTDTAPQFLNAGTYVLFINSLSIVQGEIGFKLKSSAQVDAVIDENNKNLILNNNGNASSFIKVNAENSDLLGLISEFYATNIYNAKYLNLEGISEKTIGAGFSEQGIELYELVLNKNDKIYLEKNREDALIRIFNENGEEVAKSESNDLDFSVLNSGIYYLGVSSNLNESYNITDTVENSKIEKVAIKIKYIASAPVNYTYADVGGSIYTAKQLDFIRTKQLQVTIGDNNSNYADADFYRIQVKSGDKLNVSTPNGNGFDGYLKVFDKEAFDSANSSIEFPLPPESMDGYSPTITKLEYDVQNHELTVSGENFAPGGDYQYDLKVWLVPRGDQIALPTEEGMKANKGLVWQAFTPQVSDLGNTLKITLPNDVALSMHLVYVERILKVADSGGDKKSGLPVDSNVVQAWTLGTDNVLVVSRFEITVMRSSQIILNEEEIKKTSSKDLITNRLNQEVVGRINKDENGQPLELYGSNEDQITFNADGSLAFIGGRNGKIYVVDNQTLQVIYTIKAPNSTKDSNFVGLAIASNWLYAAENNRLIRVNINQMDSEFLNEVQVVNLGINPTHGFQAIAINNMSYLALTETTGARYSWAAGAPAGNIYIIDINKIDEFGDIESKHILHISPSDFDNGRGRFPANIISGSGNGEFIVSNEQDYNNGFSMLKVITDDKGNLTGNFDINSANLTPREDDPTYLQKRVQTALQNASGVVLVEYDGIEYAIVADYFKYFTNVFWNFDDGYGANKQMGGKLGIIQDPFNKQGKFKFLGTTTPIPYGMIEHLQIGNNGLLYGNVLLDDFPFGPLTPSLFVWDARGVIDAARNADQRGQKRNIPIDRLGLNSQLDPTPIDEATPIRIDSEDKNLFNGWIYSVGAYSTPGRIIKLDKININYSIYAIDPIQAAKEQGKPLPEQPSVPDNYYTRLLGITDDQVAEDIANGKTDNWSAAKYFGKVFLYNGWNFFSGGFVGRQADRIELYETGKISESDYNRGSWTDAFFTVGGLAASAGAGTVDSNIAGGTLRGIAADAVVSNAVYQGAMIGNDVVSYAITDKIGKSLGESFTEKTVLTQLSSDAVTDVGVGLAFNLIGGRIPGSNYKVIWTAPSVKNPVPIKIVEPTSQADIRGLKGTLADSTGGNIYNSAGGEIVINKQNSTDPTRIKLPEKAVSDSAESIDASLNWLDTQGAKIKDYVDSKASQIEQAHQAVNLQQMIIRSTQNAFADGNVQAAFARYLPSKSLEQFTAEGIAKGLSGDALWKDVVASASKYTSTTAFGCFAAGTLVHTDKGLVPIQDIKVGDLVLSKPESGEGETSFKPVVNTFVHENKELWLVIAKKHWSSEGVNDTWVHPKIHRRIAEQSEFIATPNHPVWVVGRGKLDSQQNMEDIIVYPQPQWKRVDQLQQYEIVVNKDGVLFYIERAQPLYQFHNEQIDNQPSYMWYQDRYNYISPFKNADEFEDSEEAKDYFNNDYQEYLKNEANKTEIGWVRDINNYYEIGSLGLSINDTNGIAWHRNTRKDINGFNIPFTNTVYNIEVADDHTYFVTRAGVWVHNTNCEIAREILLGNLKDKDGFTQIYTSKNSFSDVVTKAINEHKSIDEIKQVGITHGGTIAADATANWARIQQLMLGSFTHFSYQGHIATKTSAGEIWEFSISVPNPITGGLNSQALGDGLITAKIDVDGNITFSNMTLDVKAGVGSYGKDQAMFKYATWNESKLKSNEFDAKQMEIDDIADQIEDLRSKGSNLTEAEKAQLDQLKNQSASLQNQYSEMTKYAFDYKRQNINNDPDLTASEKQIELAEVSASEKDFFDGLGKSMIESKTLESLITTSGALEFHGSFNHAIGPSLKDLSGDILNNPAKLKAAVDVANQNAKYLADYIAYMGTRGDLVSQIGLNTQNINLIQQAGTKWDPTTGDWLLDKIFIAKIKVVENVPIKIKQIDKATSTVKAEKIDYQTRTDVDSFYGFVKTYDANGKLKIEVKEFTRDEVIKALDPNSTDASIKSLNEVVSQIEKTEAHQLATTIPILQTTVADTLDSIAQVFDQLEVLGKDIPTQLDKTLSLEQQAKQAIHLQHDLLASAKGQFIDQYTQSAFDQMLPLKSLQQFTQESNTKGLTGNALWSDVINSIVQYTNTNTFGCFAAGTLVHTEQGWTPIQDIKVGDLVLSKPENGEGEVSYKPVLNTFVHENKELWLITSKKYWNNKDIYGKRINNRLHDSTSRISEFLATPNHPVWVVGIGVPNVEERVESIIAYTKPQWKRVDQLQQYEVMVNKDGIMFYIERAQPLYQFHNEQIEGKPSYIWYQDQYYYTAPYINSEDFEASEEFKDYVDYQEYLEKEVQKIETGWVRDIENYYVAHITGSNIKGADGIAWHRNNLTDTNGRYIPFNDTVYNLEVDGNSTYYVDSAGIFVHNTSSPEQTLLQMATDLANNVARIGTTELNQIYTVAEQYWLNAGATQSDLDKITIQLGQLKDNVLAITEDTRITVSPNAAGWGWFVDKTPNLNEEFNLGFTTYNFDAKQGSEADKKIDLLTVLIHEIGNVLGISHRTADDVMTLNINEGQRRLPNANDAKYLAWLSGQAYDQETYQAKGYAWQAPVQINDEFHDVNSGTQISNWFNQGEILNEPVNNFV